MITIKRNSNTVLTVNIPGASSDYALSLMGEQTVTLVWEQPTFTALQVGDHIVHDGAKFTLNALPTVKKLSTKLFQYNAVFQSPIYDLIKANYMLFDNTSTPPQGEFSLTGTPDTFLTLLVANLNRVFGAGTWAKGQVLEAEVKTLTFSSESCHSVLARLADEFDTEYSLTGNAVNLVEITNPANLTLEYGSTLYDIERKSIDSSSVITRLYAFGSTQNIAANYRGGSTKLLLPSPLQYLEANTSLYGIIEGQKTFDAIYPRLGATAAGTVTSVGADIFTFSDTNLDFNLNNFLMPGTPAKLRFVTGECAGYDMEIAKFTDASKTFKLIANEDDKGFKIPNVALAPAIGNKYILLDVIMPPAYVAAAEAELQAKAEEYLSENSHPKVSYTVTFSAIWAKFNAPDLKPGDLVTVFDADLGIDADLRVVKITKGITDSHNVKVDISDTVSKSTLTRIAAELAANTQGVTKANEGIRQQFARNWRNVEELSTMIDTLRTDMLFVGNVQGQFDISGTLFTPNYQNDKNKFYATPGTLRHKTIPTDIPGTWTLPAYAPTLPADATPYYLYARCNRANGAGVYHVSASALVYDADPTYYYFLVGVISSVVAGVRTLQTTYGFTQITGKSLVTGTIQSADGGTSINLDTGEIQGNIKFKSGSTYKEIGAGISEAKSEAITTASDDATAKAAEALRLANERAGADLATINTKFATLQSQVDGEVSNWFYPRSPDMVSAPVNEWDTIYKKRAHIGDTFTNTQPFNPNGTTPDAGKSWRFIETAPSSGVFQWTAIADSDAVKALLAASTAQATADGKSTTYLIQPTAYKKGDVWVLASDWNGYKSGEMLNASQDSASFNSAHWSKKVKYTDDTAIDNLVIGGRNLLPNSKLNILNATTNLEVQTSCIVEAGKEYTLSIKGRVLNGFTDCVLTKDWSQVILLSPNSSTNALYSITFTPNSSGVWGLMFFIHGDSYSVDWAKLELGNKATDWTPAPEDVAADILVAKTAGEAAQTTANTANNSVKGLKEFTDGTFVDGVINRGEAAAIEKYKNTVNVEYENMLKSYSAVYNNSYLEGAAKGALDIQFGAFQSKKTALLAAITTAISDGESNATDKANVNNAYALYTTAFKNYTEALENANKAIQDKLDALSTAKVANIKPAGKNYLVGSRTTSVTDWYLGGGTAIVVTDSKYGKVVEYSRPAGGGDFMKQFQIDRSELKNTELVYYCIAKPTPTGALFSFGGWPETSGMLTQSSPFRNLGDGWNLYYSTFVAGNDIASGNAFGLNSVKGTWRFHSFGVCKGNQPPSDWDESPKESEFLREIFQNADWRTTGGDINGGSWMTNLLRMRDTDGVVRGGLSGLAGDKVGIWTGGTYKNALDSEAKIILWKNGNAKFGNLRIGVDGEGKTWIEDPNGITRFQFSVENIETVAETLNNAGQNTTVNVAWATANVVGSYVLPQTITVLANDTELTIAGTLTAEAEANGEAVCWSDATLWLCRNGVEIVRIMDVFAEARGNDTSTVSDSFNTKLLSMAAGVYSLKLVFMNSSEGYGPYTSASTSPITMRAFKSLDNRAMIFGADGLSLFNDMFKYFHYKNGALSARGAWDVPAGLGGGTVSTGGGLAGAWGGKPPTGCGGTTSKTITHEIGNTDYTILITMTSNHGYHVGGKTATQIQVVTAGSFEFIFVRTK